MSESYAKLFSTITTSTIWSEPMPTRVVWITMLAMSDRHGEVHASVPGLARIANVSMDECLAALATFFAPDAYSRTPDNEGRRIAVIDGGWCLLNHAKYRAKRDAEDRKERQARWIADKRARASKTADKTDSDENVDGSVDNGRQVDESRQSRHITASATATEKKEIQGASPDGEALPAEPKSDPIPYSRIVAEFNRVMVNLPKVREVTQNRKTAIRGAWVASASRQSVEFWTAFFEECADDPFLNGTGPYKHPHENWRPDFDHLLKAKVVTKVYERAMDRLERAA